MRSWQKNGKQIVAVNFSLEHAALEILRRRSASPRTYGHFIARLLYEFEAREEERQRLRQELQAVMPAIAGSDRS